MRNLSLILDEILAAVVVMDDLKALGRLYKSLTLGIDEAKQRWDAAVDDAALDEEEWDEANTWWDTFEIDPTIDHHDHVYLYRGNPSQWRYAQISRVFVECLSPELYLVTHWVSANLRMHEIRWTNQLNAKGVWVMGPPRVAGIFSVFDECGWRDLKRTKCTIVTETFIQHLMTVELVRMVQEVKGYGCPEVRVICELAVPNVSALIKSMCYYPSTAMEWKELNQSSG
ncbi:hypothetical protein HDV00_011044 [Rhizophlyctis rosea]|nr:hypothetical protein HDV00_011044 [Rhizophlyctis rosea]